MQFGVVTLFPEILESVTNYGVTGRAVRDGLINVHHWNPRQFTQDRHQTVDDRPYGGGPGMLMKVDPLAQALSAAREVLGADVHTVYLSPQGRRFNQTVAQEYAQRGKLLLLAGRYEGIDERLITREVDEELSLGDFVLSGGELPAVTVIDAVSRLLPGVLGHASSAGEDSFADGLLDCPHYTRPEQLLGEEVPPVLLSGNHEAIRRWRLQQALGRTWLRRPDLLSRRRMSALERSLLKTFIDHYRAED